MPTSETVGGLPIDVRILVVGDGKWQSIIVGFSTLNFRGSRENEFDHGAGRGRLL